MNGQKQPQGPRRHGQGLILALRERWLFWRDLWRFQRSEGANAINFGPLVPRHGERGTSSAEIDNHYFHQDLWAARRIQAARPRRHVDIGSRIDGFVSHCLVFMPVEVVDIRPLALTCAGLSIVQADAVSLGAFAADSLPSLSSLHAAEHFGLGRYGDPIDPRAHLVFMKSLQRVLAIDGRLYFSVPLSDRERVEFNAHRIFRPETILAAFDALTLTAFALIKDDGRIYEPALPADVRGQDYACGLFEFTKPGKVRESGRAQ
jgi:hypothetical protein